MVIPIKKIIKLAHLIIVPFLITSGSNLNSIWVEFAGIDKPLKT